MTTEEFLEKLAGLRAAAKAAILAGLALLLIGGYWYVFYGDLSDERKKITDGNAALKTELAGYQKRREQLLAFRNEVNQLLEEQKELLRVLPKKDDIEQFIESVNAQVELSGLSKVASVRDNAVAEEMYMRIPIRMSLTGSFHQINRFFKNVGELKRIVTISDLQLKPSDIKELPGALKADFVAQTFQFLDTSAPQAGGSR